MSGRRPGPDHDEVHACLLGDELLAPAGGAGPGGNGVPPRSRNHRLPTGPDTPQAIAASSLVSPSAIFFQKHAPRPGGPAVCPVTGPVAGSSIGPGAAEAPHQGGDHHRRRDKVQPEEGGGGGGVCPDDWGTGCAGRQVTVLALGVTMRTLAVRRPGFRRARTPVPRSQNPAPRPRTGPSSPSRSSSCTRPRVTTTHASHHSAATTATRTPPRSVSVHTGTTPCRPPAGAPAA